MPTCPLCDSAIVAANDSKEHIIPLSIGGRKSVMGFICRDCNNKKGAAWDSVLASRLNWFCVALNVNRASGVPPMQRVKAADGQELWLRSDGSMERHGPVVTVKKTATGKQFHLKPRSLQEAREKLEEIGRKYPKVDVEKVLSTVQMGTTHPGVIGTEFDFSGHPFGRSLVKTAVAMAYQLGIAPQACDHALSYLKDVPGSPTAVTDFFLRDLVKNRSLDYLVNSVTVSGNPYNSRLYAYVEYFGLARYLVHLSQHYSGPPVLGTYAVNTATGKTVELDVDLNLSDAEFALSLAHDAVDQRQQDAVSHYTMPIVLKSLYAREDQNAVERATVEAREVFGIKANEDVPPEMQSAFKLEVDQKLATYFEIAGRLRPKL
jgi:hypothetical protein